MWEDKTMKLSNFEKILENVLSCQESVEVRRMLSAIQAVQSLGNMMKCDTKNDYYKTGLARRIQEIESFIVLFAPQRLTSFGIDINAYKNGIVESVPSEYSSVSKNAASSTSTSSGTQVNTFLAMQENRENMLQIQQMLQHLLTKQSSAHESRSSEPRQIEAPPAPVMQQRVAPVVQQMQPETYYQPAPQPVQYVQPQPIQQPVQYVQPQPVPQPVQYAQPQPIQQPAPQPVQQMQQPMPQPVQQQPVQHVQQPAPQQYESPASVHTYAQESGNDYSAEKTWNELNAPKPKNDISRAISEAQSERSSAPIRDIPVAKSSSVPIIDLSIGGNSSGPKDTATQGRDYLLQLLSDKS